MVTVGDGMDGVTQIPQQVPAVGDLDGIGRTLARAVGVDAGPVSGDDLDAGVGPQPRGQALSCRSGSRSTTRLCSTSTRTVP